MSQEIADEIKMIVELPHLGQLMGVLFICLGILQIIFLPLKNFISRRFCFKNVQISDLNNKDVKGNSLDVRTSPEVSPLITDKPRNGIILLGNLNQSNLRS